jgi:xanthine dehydrogenase small subunit
VEPRGAESGTAETAAGGPATAGSLTAGTRVAEPGTATPRVVVNGRARELGEVGGHVTLLEWLRGSGLTGGKEGCAEGECGACAVLVARDDGQGRACWVALNACLVPAAAFDQQEVVTAEGLGRLYGSGQLHPVQREMAERGGSQCGYCTPGFICSMAAEYYRPGRGEMNGHHDAEHGPNGFDLHALSGNLCRCTGYRPIRDAAYALGQPEAADPFLERLAEPAPAPAATAVSSTQGRYVRPASLTEALTLLAAEPDAQLVAGSTDWGVELNIRHARAALTVGIDRIPELREFSVSGDRIDIGAALSLTEIEARLAGRVPLLGALFPQFASRLIRNGATLGGNLGTASPIGDTTPALLALDVSLVLASSQGEREVRLAEYFTGYRRSVRRPGELIKTIRIPLPAAPVTAFHKIAKRRFDDISGVAVAYALTLSGDGPTAGGTVDARGGRGGRRGDGRGRDADERPPGQPGLPDRHAAQLAAEVLRPDPASRDDRRGRP